VPGSQRCISESVGRVVASLHPILQSMAWSNGTDSLTTGLPGVAPCKNIPHSAIWCYMHPLLLRSIEKLYHRFPQTWLHRDTSSASSSRGPVDPLHPWQKIRIPRWITGMFDTRSSHEFWLFAYSECRRQNTRSPGQNAATNGKTFISWQVVE
jgi:hypothetical protein